MVSTPSTARPSRPYATHDVTNQPPDLAPYDAAEDTALLEGLRREGAGWAEEDIRRLGLRAGSAEARRPADRFTAFAAVVRHLLADPVLPPELLPPDWPGTALRSAYADFQREITGSIGRSLGR